MSNFNPNDTKHQSAIADLKSLTGLDFTLKQVNTSDGEIWVYRTESIATFVPDYDLLSIDNSHHSLEVLEGKKPKAEGTPDITYPLNITPSKTAAYKVASSLHTNLFIMNSDSFGKVIEETNKNGPNNHRASAIDLGDGNFKGALDYYAETSGDRAALSLDSLREEAEKASSQETTVIPPEFWTKPTTKDDIDRISALKKGWHDKIINLSQSEDIITTDSKIAAATKLSEEENLQKHQQELIKRIQEENKNRNKGGIS